MKNPKYNKEIKPNVIVDVYDVLQAWKVTNPALQHLIKKGLQAGNRGHKTLEQDMDDIIASAIRAKEIELGEKKSDSEVVAVENPQFNADWGIYDQIQKGYPNANELGMYRG